MQVVHVWEGAGLGKAPYRFLGLEVSKFQACPGAPVKAGSSCDYCPASIMNCFWFESADGKPFKVGCECFYKANADRSLRAKVDAAVRAHDRKVAAERAKRRAEKTTAAHGALLAELDGWTEGFAGEFARSVAKQIRKGKAPSPRQLACIAKLRAELVT